MHTAATALTAVERAGLMLVGVSGGPDSLVLLHLLWRWRQAGGPSVHAVHVDHQLREGSAADAAHVARYCHQWDVPLTVVPVAVEVWRERRRTGLEDAARQARYQALAQVAQACGARVVALAHHANDQAETVLLQLARGAGLAGLRGMPVARRGGDALAGACATCSLRLPLWRPLLTIQRRDIEAYCVAHALAPLRDPLNDDRALRRNVVRHDLLPLLERQIPGASQAIVRSAGLLAVDEAFIEEVVAREWPLVARLEAHGLVTFARAPFRRYHRALQRRFIRRAWMAVAQTAQGLPAAPVEQACQAIVAGRTGARLSLPHGVALLVDRDEATVGPVATVEPALRQRLGVPLLPPGQLIPVREQPAIVLTDGWSVAVSRQATTSSGPLAVHIPLDIVAQAAEPLVIRTWQPGDRLALPHAGGTQKLQDWFVDRGVPRYARAHLVLVALGDRIVWVAGLAAFPPSSVIREGWRFELRRQGIDTLPNEEPLSEATGGAW